CLDTWTPQNRAGFRRIDAFGQAGRSRWTALYTQSTVPIPVRTQMRHLLSLALQHDQDVVTARTRAAQLGQMLGFDSSEQTRVATAVSEIVRNAFRYATGGSVAFAVDEEAKPQRLI